MLDISRYCRSLARLFKLEIWGIGIIQRRNDDVSALLHSGRLGEVEWLPRLKSWRYRADPFIWHADDGLRLIFEDYAPWFGRARICSVPLAAVDDIAGARLEIGADTHFSYPFIVEADGACYCIPENAESGRVSIYRWNPGEHRWHMVANLIDEPVLDPTPYYHEGIWYLFGTLLNDGPDSKLRIWHSRALLGPWHAHKHNPIKTDNRGSRSAGPLFRDEDSLYRPAQDATGGYGSAVTLYRIEQLSPEVYSETAVSRVLPDPGGQYPDGLHTLTVTSYAIIVDGKVLELTWAAPIVKALRRSAHRWRKWRASRRSLPR